MPVINLSGGSSAISGPAAGFARVVAHGATAGTARPDAELVIWKGTVEPSNGEDGDIYVDTSL